ncbi:MAG: hypothetical protein AMXMBFR13_11090 [Phycisphaerae bacterium]|jgi:cell division protein FtsW
MAMGQVGWWQTEQAATGPVEYPAGRLTATSILAIAAGLMGVGAVMTFSASASPDRPLVGWEFWKYPAVRQLVFVAGGMTAMLVTAQLPYRVWAAARGKPGLFLMGFALVCTALVLVPGLGIERKGASRWVRIPPASLGLQFQPSELVKLALPIGLAIWMTLRADVRHFWRGLLPAAGIIGLSVGAVGLEDFGTAALLAVVGGAMLLFGGARWIHVMLMVLPAVPVFGYLLLSRAHRMTRLVSFLDIWADPERTGYQAIQSLCTIASGGWWGRGLGRGFVKGYLPEAHSDFIFAVICEELGMVGAVAVVALLIALLWQGLTVIRRCQDPFGRLLAFALVVTLGIQATMNIAVVTVSMPTKGISLPLVSAGGSGVVFLGALVGVLANIAKTSPAVGADDT